MTGTKTLYIIALIALLVVSMGACIGSGDESTVVYMLYAGNKGDYSYNDSAYRGLYRSQMDSDIIKREFVLDDIEDIDAMMCQSDFCEEPDVIICEGYTYHDYLDRWAQNNPTLPFVAIDQTAIDCENIHSVEIVSFGASYLAGALAAEVSATGKIGIILGTPSWLLDVFLDGYVAGAKAADPSVEVMTEYISDDYGGFSDPEKAKSISHDMNSCGVDIIYGVAGYSVVGIISASKESDSLLVIGVDSDQSDLGPTTVVASCVKRVDSLVCDIIDDAINGTVTFPNYSWVGLGQGMTSLVFNPLFSEYEYIVPMYQEMAILAEEQYMSGAAESLS